MEALTTSVVNYGNEEKAPQSLVDAFGSMLSAQQIGSASRQASKSTDVAGHILDDKLGSSSNADAPDKPGKLLQANGYTRSSKLKCPPASIGTISSFLGKDYVKCKPLATWNRAATKPLKLNAELLSVPDVLDSKVDATGGDCMHKEMEDFLFKMLGQVFQLDRNEVEEVLGICGYDMQKSMEKLFDYSASVMNRKKITHDESTQKYSGLSPKSETYSFQRKVENRSNPEGDRQQVRSHLQKEVLTSLFTAPERHEDLRSPVEPIKRSIKVRPVVDEPIEDTTPEYKTRVANLHEDNSEKTDEEDSYSALRRAVQEYRSMAKEYFGAAINAFKNGDRHKADKLLKEGQHFQEMACEADEESNKKMLETEPEEKCNVTPLDLHEFTAKEAIRLLKCHLSSMAGILSFKYLKVIIETSDEDASRGARRKWIMKLLERESIEWIEEGTAGTILIPLEKIDSKRLSFAERY